MKKQKYKMVDVFKKVGYPVVWIAFIGYLLILMWRLFFYAFGGYYRTNQTSTDFNFIPFKTISNYLNFYAHYNFEIWFINLFGNVFAFMPFGFLLPIILKKFKKVKMVVLATFLTSLSAEVAQMVLKVGSFDVDDLLLNTIGGVAGFGVFILFNKWFYEEIE
mgnify:CR=1 FL=1